MPASPCTSVSLTPIGRIESDYPDKFGVPRQPGLADAARARLVLTPPFDDPWRCVAWSLQPPLGDLPFPSQPRALDALVRPPRLGGNARIGVFASRSTHRPNRLGQSLVELEGIDTDAGVSLRLRSVDLVDGTPVLDIKPYLPWAEARPEARAGFAPEPPPCCRYASRRRHKRPWPPDPMPPRCGS